MPYKNSKVYLAVDIGASSGRLMAGVWNGETLDLEEVSRFPTPSEKIGIYSYWNILALYSDIKGGIDQALKTYGERIVSIAVDTWGVDYGLLDKKGELLANPICYRDDRTAQSFKDLPERLGKDLIYSETGIQFMFFNTFYQLSSEVGAGRPAFEAADRILFLPDLLNYWLSGVEATERSIASTSQMLNPQTGTWSVPILKALGLDPSFFGKLTESGTRLGPLKPELTKGQAGAEIQVVTAPGHDTASAFLALGRDEPGFAIMSSGTWSLMGLELKEANCGSDAMEAGFSNEIGFDKSVRFLKNICGLWLIEECRRQWMREGTELGYEEILRLSKEAEPMESLFDPDDPRFAKPGNMPRRIAEYCRETDQEAPNSYGEIARSIYDSLAMKYRYVFEQLKAFAEEPIRGLHVLGGGSRNALLNQLTADALGAPVWAGPAEATALGNIMAQMIASGEISNVEEGRHLIGRSFDIERYEPSGSEAFEEASARFDDLVKRGETLESK